MVLAHPEINAVGPGSVRAVVKSPRMFEALKFVAMSEIGLNLIFKVRYRGPGVALALPYVCSVVLNRILNWYNNVVGPGSARAVERFSQIFAVRTYGPGGAGPYQDSW